MTRKLDERPLKTLERAVESLGDRVRALPEASRPGLETALQELSQAIAALCQGLEASESPRPESPCGRAASPAQCEPILQHLFNAIPDLLTIIDRDHNVVMSNWHVSDLILEEIKPGQSKCYRVYHRRDRPCEDCHVLKVFGTGQPQKIEKINEIDGQPLEFSAFPIRDASGQVILVAEHVRDIAERHLAEQALKESEERFRTLFEYAPDAYFLMDLQGNFLDVNLAAEEISGYGREELIGKNYQALPLFDDRQNLLIAALLEQAVHGEILGPVELCLNRKADGQVIIEAKGLPLHRKGEGLLLGIARDITARRLAEEELFQHHLELQETAQRLEQSRNMLQLIIESIPVRVFWKDSDLRYLGCNTLFARDAGFDQPQQLLGQDDFAMGWREQAHLYRMDDRQVMESLRPKINIVEPQTTPAGAKIWLKTSKVPLQMPNGEVFGVLGAYEDITTHKQAEEALRESEARFRTVFEFAPVGVGMADPRGRVLETNQALQALLGYNADELRAMSVQEMTHPEDWPKTLQLQQELSAGKVQHYSLEKRYLRKDGGIVWAQVMVALLRDVQGEPQYLLATIIDRTARKQAEAELRNSEQRFRLMAENIHDVFWITTPGIGQTLYVSPAFEQVWGRPSEELYRDPNVFIDSIHPEDRERVKSEVLVGHRQGIPWNHEYRIIKPDGTVRWIQDRGFPVRDDQGRVIMFTGVATDITGRKALEEQLLQAQKMEAVGRLAGGVAHDFNNLLMAITGYGELMRTKVLKDDPLYGHLENILKAGDRATALIQQLLTFSRRQIVHSQVVDLNRVVLDLEPMLRRLLGEDLDLAVLTDQRLGAVKADPGQLGQIIMNLVVNARDAMPKGGRLTLKTAAVDFTVGCHSRFGLAPPGPYVMLEVSDTGMGMDEATQTHVFEPFFTTKEPGKGTGLGLSTVYGIVKQSGGYLDLASEPGKGSTFTIYLPRLDAAVEPPKVKIPITASFRGEETILLVEDEDVLRALLAKFLRLYGYTVLEARHGGEALLTCERHQGPIHLMVTDLVMPQMSGRELADRLHPLRPEMKILYMSGYTEDALVQHGVADLSVTFLQKPFKPIELARRVHAVLHPPASQARFLPADQKSSS